MKFFSLDGTQRWIQLHAFWGNGGKFINDICKFIATGFGIGMLTSYFVDNKKVLMVCSKKIIKLIALTALVIALLTKMIGSDFIFVAFLLGFFFFVVTLDQTPDGFLSWKPFQLLGHISYGFYLYHGICLFWIFFTVNLYTPVESLSAFSFWSYAFWAGFLALILSFLSYRFIEIKFLKL